MNIQAISLIGINKTNGLYGIEISKMVRLFVSDRILVDGRFCNGAIVVNKDGKIEEVFKNETETSEWLDENHHVEVCPRQ